MMKDTLRWWQTPPSVTVRVKPNRAQSLHIRRGLRLKRANDQDARGPPEKSQPRQHQDEMYYTKMTMPPTIVIQRQEMASYFSLFAMTFVYFKRARFTIAEYTRKNFFIALYLANTMEEDEEESKYEIFPWALGKNWRKHFPRFLKQRDKLWARIEYRAAVSRRCCEEVMAIMPSHFVWQRERSEHHSGAQRQYGDRDQTRLPRGPAASPVLCALCDRSTRLDQGSGFSSPSRGSSAQTPNPSFSHPFASMLSLEKTPPRASHKKVVETKRKAQRSSCCADEVPRNESSGSIYDSSMDWINEE
ncbi:hypothetical protein PAMA_004434 [Pampus argenteus]